MAPEKKRRKRTKRGDAPQAGPETKPGRARRPKTLGLAWVFWFLVCLEVFAVFPGAMSSNYLPKTVWASATVGLGLLVLRPRISDRLEITFLGALWLAYLSWALLSLTWTPSARAGLDRLLALLLPTLGYLLAKRSRFWKSDIFWTCFAGVAGAVALIGILQYLPEKIVTHPVKTLVNWFPGTAVPRTTMGERNYAAMYFTLTAPFFAWFYFRAKGRRALVPLVVFLLSMLLLALVRARGAWLGCLASLAFLFLAGLTRKLRSHPGKTRVLVAALAAAAAMAIVLKPDARVASALGPAKRTISATLADFLNPSHRAQYWMEVLSVPLNPLTGGGFGNYPIHATPCTREKMVKSLNWEVHNDYLQAYVDLGIPGCALFCAVLAHLLFLAWKGRKSDGRILAAGAAIAGLCVQQFFTFTSELVSSLMWTAGAISILNSQKHIVPVIRPRVPPRFLFLLNLAAALWLFAFAAIAGYALRGDRLFRDTQRLIQAALSGNADYRRPEYAKRAAREIKWLVREVLPTMRFDANMRHVTCNQFAQFAMDAQDLASAETFSRYALSLHPTDRAVLFHLVKIALTEKKFDEAEKLLRRGVETFGNDPYDVFAPNLLNLLIATGRKAEAENLQQKMELNRIETPRAPSPKNGDKNAPCAVAFDWSDCRAAASYELYVWQVGEKKPEEPVRKDLVKSATSQPMLLKPGVTYLWQVRAMGRYGVQWGEPWVFRTAAAADAAP